jgi:hypothetical protein
MRLNPLVEVHPAPPKKRWRLALIVIFLISLIWIVCSSPLTTIIVSKQGQKHLHTQVSVQQASWNPLSGEIHLKGVEIKAPEGLQNTRSLLLHEVTIKNSPWALFQETKGLNELVIDSPKLSQQKSIRELLDWLSDFREHMEDHRKDKTKYDLIRRLKIVHLAGTPGDELPFESATLIISEFSNKPWLHPKPMTAVLVGNSEQPHDVIFAGGLDFRPGAKNRSDNRQIQLDLEALNKLERDAVFAIFAAKEKDPKASRFKVEYSKNTVQITETETDTAFIDKVKNSVLPLRLRSEALQYTPYHGMLFNVRAPLEPGQEEEALQTLRKTGQLLNSRLDQFNVDRLNFLKTVQQTVDGVKKSTKKIIDKTRETVRKLFNPNGHKKNEPKPGLDKKQ